MDQYAEQLHQCNTSSIGFFPTWIPGTTAALYHGPTQITTDIPNYICNATHKPPMCAYLIKWSQNAMDHGSKWIDITYDNIAWQHLSKAFQCLMIGQCTQLLKYINGIFPTAKQLQMFHNKHVGRCFDCNQLWEDTNHVL